MFQINILLNTIRANAYRVIGDSIVIPSWADSINDDKKTFKVESCYRSEDNSGAWKAAAWSQHVNRIHSRVHFPTESNASLQYMGVDFVEYAKRYNPTEVPSDWQWEDLEVADEAILRRTVEPLMDDCAAKCWMQDDCDQAYLILRSHINENYDEGTNGNNGVKGYEDIRAKKQKAKMVISYCHMFNGNIGPSYPVNANSDGGLWTFPAVENDADVESVDGDTFSTFVYQKPNATEGFCGDNLCPYSSSIDKYFYGSAENIMMSDPLNRTMSDTEFIAGLDMLEKTSGVTIKEMKDSCNSNNECVAVAFERLVAADQATNDVGEQLYDGTLYKFHMSGKSVLDAITSYEKAGSVHMKDNTYFPLAAEGNGTMLKLSQCRVFKKPHLETIISSPTWLLAPLLN